MSTVELRKRLIEKIQATSDDHLLEEANRLFEIETEELDIYLLNDEQKTIIGQSRQQISQGKFISDEQANKEIDEWLGE